MRIALACTTAFAVALAAPASARAQDVGARAYVTPGTTVQVGAPFVLNVEITGTQQLQSEPILPDLERFARYLGNSAQSSIQVVNGRRAVSITVQYRYQAVAEGSFDVPALQLVAGGQSLTTEPLRVTVSAQAPQGTPPTQAPGGGGAVGTADPGQVGPDDIFITAEASKTHVVEGEPLVVEYRIWTRVDVTAFNFTRVPEPDGFWVEDVTPQGQPVVEQRTRDGQQFATAVIRRVALVPTGAGERTVDPIVLEAQVRVRADDPFDRFFGGRSLFGGGTVPAGVASGPLAITVDPLPPGAPQPFSGIVGQLEITASLDRDSVQANGAVTLTVRASGDGNIRAIPAPSLDLEDDFEVFPPEVSESVRAFGAGLSGEKTFEYVLIPRAPGRREIPAVTMGYLDGETAAYRVASTEALPLVVSGEVTNGPAALARGGVAQLRQDIRFIHLGAAVRPIARPLFDGAAFWIFALLPLAGIAGALGLRRHRDLLEGDVAYARGRRAGRVAKKRLADARRLADGDDPRAFYAEVARAVRGLVADKLNLAEAGLQTAELARHLERRAASAETVAELRACLEHCDRQRFAPPGQDPQERSRFLDRAGRLMTAIDRALA
jgi:hypothetical protein